MSDHPKPEHCRQQTSEMIKVERFEEGPEKPVCDYCGAPGSYLITHRDSTMECVCEVHLTDEARSLVEL